MRRHVRDRRVVGGLLEDLGDRLRERVQRGRTKVPLIGPSLVESAGSVRLLNVVNSLDTPVCGVETRRWEELRRGLPDNVRVCTVSMDLPFAQSRFCGAEDIEHEALSAHASEDFGREYGVLLKEWRLLQRAVFVIDGDGIVTHAEYVDDQMLEPDYDAAVAAAASSDGE